MKKNYFIALFMLVGAFAQAQITCPASIKTNAGSTPSTPTFVLDNGQGCTGWPSTITVDGSLTYDFVSCSGVNLKYAIQGGQTPPSDFSLDVDFGSGTCNYDVNGDLVILSSKDVSNIEASINPNPTTGLIKIALSNQSKVEKVEIYSVSGRIVYNTSNTGIIDISSLSSGLYILKAKTNEGQFSRKIIKQ